MCSPRVRRRGAVGRRLLGIVCGLYNGHGSGFFRKTSSAEYVARFLEGGRRSEEDAEISFSVSVKEAPQLLHTAALFLLLAKQFGQIILSESSFVF